MMTSAQQITFRPTRDDEDILEAIHNHLGRMRRTAFVTRTDAIRFALREAEKAITRPSDPGSAPA